MANKSTNIHADIQMALPIIEKKIELSREAEWENICMHVDTAEWMVKVIKRLMLHTDSLMKQESYDQTKIHELHLIIKKQEKEISFLKGLPNNRETEAIQNEKDEQQRE